MLEARPIIANTHLRQVLFVGYSIEMEPSLVEPYPTLFAGFQSLSGHSSIFEDSPGAVPLSILHPK